MTTMGRLSSNQHKLKDKRPEMVLKKHLSWFQGLTVNVSGNIFVYGQLLLRKTL